MIQTIRMFVWVAAHLLSLCLLVAIAFTIGDLFLRRVPFASTIERAIIAIALGFGTASLALLCLGVAGLLYSQIILGLTVTGALGAAWRLAVPSTVLAVKDVVARARGMSVWYKFVTLAIAVYWLLLFLPALYPPIQWDATTYHLVLARQYLEAHSIQVDLGIHWPIVPLLNQLLFAWAMAILDDELAQLVVHSFFVLTALALFSWGRRSGHPIAGLTAAVVWVSHPLVRWLSTAAYVDVSLSCYTFLAVYSLRMFWEMRERAFWIVAMALAAFAAGVKITGVATVAGATAFGILLLLRGKLAKSAVLRGIGAALLTGAPWYVLIGVHTGNPIWPILPQLSNGVWADPRVIERLGYFFSVGTAKTPINFLLVPLLLVFDLSNFQPDNDLNLIPIFLLFPVCWLISFFDEKVRWWTLWSALIMVAWFSTSQQVRLLLPALPLVSVAILEAVRWTAARVHAPPAALQRVWWVAIVSTLVVGLGLTTYQTARRGAIPVTLEQRESWRARTVSGYGAIKFLETRARRSDLTYLISVDWLTYFCRTRTRVKSGFVEQAFIPQNDPWPSSTWGPRLQREGVHWIVLNHDDYPRSSDSNSPLKSLFAPAYNLVYEDFEVCVFEVKTTDDRNELNERRARAQTAPVSSLSSR